MTNADRRQAATGANEHNIETLTAEVKELKEKLMQVREFLCYVKLQVPSDIFRKRATELHSLIAEDSFEYRQATRKKALGDNPIRIIGAQHD